MAVERLYIENTYIPISAGLNPSITKSIVDLEEPEKRKATYSKTVSVPRSKEADKIFSAIFEVNLIDLTFNVRAKADCLYTVDDEALIDGYLQLKEIKVTDFNDIVYDCVMYSDTADFWASIKEGYLTDLYTSSVNNYEGLDIYDHPFTREIQEWSWDYQIIENGGAVAFDYGKGYVYPLVDYGYSSDATNFSFTQIPCAIYVKEYLKRMIAWAGFEYDSSWIDGSVCERLIIPASPSTYVLSSAEIEDMQFVANTPEFLSNGTTKTANLTKNNYSAEDQIIFTNDSVSPATDPGLNYDPTTGEFECVTAGLYDLTALVDLNGEFKPATANNVKTRCEIMGYLYLYYIANGSATEVMIDSLPFWITYNDGGAFTSGTRTTDTTATYEDKSYLQFSHYNVYPNASTLVGRLESVPDRYQLTATNINLLAGDKVIVKYKAGVFRKASAFTYTTDFFVDNVGTYYTGDAKLICSVGAFYNKVVNTTLREGNILTVDKVIPKNVKMTDFLTSILKMFNLWIDIDPLNPYKVIIENRDTYLGSDVLNIHELIDRGKEMQHIPMGALDVKRFNYRYKKDNDYWNKKYETSYSGEIYGNRWVDTTGEFFTQEKNTEVIFSPTPLVGLPGSDRVLPTIYQLNDSNQPIVTQHNIRILYYGGLKSCSTTWNHINYVLGWPYVPVPHYFTEYPYAGHFDDPFNPTLDINWGLVKEVYYDDNLQTITATNANLVNVYHSKQLMEITAEDSRIIRAYVHLTPAKYKEFTFDKLYYFDWAYFRLNKIGGYNPTSEETTLCEFLKVANVGNFTATTMVADGGENIVEPALPGGGSGGGVVLEERFPTKGTGTSQQPDGNNVGSKSVSVSGEGNYVGLNTKNVEIYGDNNQVTNGSENVKIQGDNNIVTGKNVTIINASDLTIEENDVTYIDGKKSGSWVTETANFTADSAVQGYYLDASGGNIRVTISDRDELANWIFKRIDTSANTVTLDPTGAYNIDGSATQTLLSYESIGIRWNDELGEFSIVD